MTVALRAGAKRLFETQTRPPWNQEFLRPGDLPIAEIPGSPGCVICVGLVAARRDEQRGQLVFQTFRLGPNQMRVALTSKVFVPSGALALFGEAIAKAIEIASGDEVGILPSGDTWEG